MRRQLDLGYLNDVLLYHYESKSDMAEAIGITRSHFQEVLKNKGIGTKVLSGLKSEAKVRGFDYELCLKPAPIFINKEAIESIEVTDQEGGLIASITSNQIITHGSTKVIVVPVKD
ncbi:hypothetical protein [Planococcus versutus]|uniref:Uncharacterized protein n=1 Tax=Planococcus versutus TaxID=1302659 RepID=A0A1B1S5E4_9BACL|nr:hypothetical protein [Planococcus versutus]ANU28416.1 hypothetical protein I858_015610 [Planococcus versutus]